MTARRARQVRIRRGQLTVWCSYRRRFEEQWRRKAPLGMWVDYATVNRAMLERYPWLEGWGPIDAFSVHMTMYSNTVAIPRVQAELDAMFGAARAPGTKTNLLDK